MGKLTPTLIAISLALALSPAMAEQVTTSQGSRELPSLQRLSYESELREAARSGEEVAAQLLVDIAAAEKSRSSVDTDAAGFAEQVKQADADYAEAKAALDAKDQDYASALAAFGQREQALAGEIENQRAAAAPVEALPSAQRDIQEVFRLNEWAARNDKEREALAAENTRLLDEHSRIEDERARLAKQAADSNAKLRGRRDALLGTSGSNADAINRNYTQLRFVVDYLDKAYAALAKVAHSPVTPAAAYGQARAKLGSGR